MYKFFEKNSLNVEYHNLLKLLYDKNISLKEIKIAYQKEDIELFLFFHLSNLIKYIPEKYLTQIKQRQIPLKSILTFNEKELISDQEFKQLSDSYEIYYNCFLRKINYFKLDYKFLHFCTDFKNVKTYNLV